MEILWKRPGVFSGPWPLFFRGSSRSVPSGGAPRVMLELFELTDVMIRVIRKAGFMCGPRPVGWVTAPGRMGEPRPVRWATAPGHMGGPRPVTHMDRVRGKMSWIRERCWCKELILLEPGLGENFLGAKSIVTLYFLSWEVGLFCVVDESRLTSLARLCFLLVLLFGSRLKSLAQLRLFSARLLVSRLKSLAQIYFISLAQLCLSWGC